MFDILHGRERSQTPKVRVGEGPKPSLRDINYCPSPPLNGSLKERASREWTRILLGVAFLLRIFHSSLEPQAKHQPISPPTKLGHLKFQVTFFFRLNSEMRKL